MTTKPSNVGLDRGIYSSPFDAFTNYMNILGDFISRVKSLYPMDIDNEQLNSLLTTIKNQGDEIEMKEKEIERLQTKIAKIEAASDKLRDKIDKVDEKKAIIKKKMNLDAEQEKKSAPIKKKSTK